MTRNAVAERRAWGAAESEILDPTRAEDARTEMSGWPGYAPTPLHRLDGLAERLGVGELWLKDESGRFGIGSFKALGGAYGVLRGLRRRLGPEATTSALLDGPLRERASGITTTCATAGNHGRSVAWGSELFGCRCVVFLPADASDVRAGAIAGHGAEVIRTTEPYDVAVEMAQRTAEREGWLVISDTSYEGYTEIPRDVMHGYTLMADEALEELASPPTHVVVQAGVGGLSTAVCGHLWHRLGESRPFFVLVEPVSADCFFRSAAAGRLEEVEGPFDTMMGGLASGVPSLLAWRLLSRCADYVVAIDDEDSKRAMRDLAAGSAPDHPVVAGESGAAGVGALLALAEDPEARDELGLGPASRVLAFVTEGAMDPPAWERIVGRAPDGLLRGTGRP